MSELLAFEVEIQGMRVVVFAWTAAKARWLAVKDYRAAGYGTRGDWPRPESHRLPEYDDHSLKLQGPHCWAPSYVRERGIVSEHITYGQALSLKIQPLVRERPENARSPAAAPRAQGCWWRKNGW